jgi:sigma-B regulation protein RsbU (phosphoserine phosphatase)
VTLSEQPLHEDLEDLYENAPCGYLSLGPDGRIVKANRTFCTWIGRSSDELLGKRLRDLLNVAGSIFYETHFAPLLRMQGFFHEVALDLVVAGGAVMPVLANAKERRDDAGQLLFTRLTIFQATERRRYERELVDSREAERAARKELQELNATLEAKVAEQVAARLQEQETSELREQFIAVLGHDLRNPLAAIDAGASRLLRDGAWTDRTTTILRLMKNSVARMSGLIDNVLDLARSRLGGGIALDLNRERALASTLEQVVEEIRTAYPDRRIEAKLEIPAPVAVDHHRIAQMFSNLLGNAVSHGADDQPIRVEGLLDDESGLRISVSNAGDPIPPEMMEHLFKAFYRGQVRSNGEGLGLGLYIASQIAEAHGGSIDVQSDPHETRFTFSMPVVRP